MESLFKDLLKTLTKHSHILNALSSTMINHSLVIKSMIGVCEKCSVNIATVKHVKYNYKFCDSCAAREIVLYQNENDSESEKYWEDLEEAIEKRHLSTFVDALNENTQIKLH